MQIPASKLNLAVYRETTAGARLRSQAASTLEAVLPAESVSVERYLYDGVISREQAIKGAVIGQYVRMAQSQPILEPWRWDDCDEAPYVRRDLLAAMMTHMSAAVAGRATGSVVADRA